jgi:hypothetical protein
MDEPLGAPSASDAVPHLGKQVESFDDFSHRDTDDT